MDFLLIKFTIQINIPIALISLFIFYYQFNLVEGIIKSNAY